jgi:hypothetical protein
VQHVLLNSLSIAPTPGILMKTLLGVVLIAVLGRPCQAQAPEVHRLEVFRPASGGSHWIDTTSVSTVGRDAYQFKLMIVLPMTLTLADGTTHDRMEATMEFDCRGKRSRILSMRMLSGEQVVTDIPASGEPAWIRSDAHLGLVYCPVLRRAVLH